MTTSPKTKPAEFTANRKSLIEALTYVGPAVAKKCGVMPILRGVHIDTRRTHVHVTATDLDLMLWQDTPIAAVTAGDPFVVDATWLTKTLKALPDENVTVRAEGGDNGTSTVHVTCGSHAFTAEGMAVKDFPRVLHEVDGPGADWDTAVLDALREVVPFTSTDDARPILTGVLVESTGLVATDSYRLAHRAIMVPGVADETPLLLNGKHVKYMGAKATTWTEDGGRYFAWTCDGRGGGWSRLIDGQFPNWRQLVPDPLPPNGYTFDRKGMLAAIKPLVAAHGRASDATLRFSRGDALDPVPGVGGDLAVSLVDHGRLSTAYLPGATTGEWGTVALNAQYFRQAVEAFNADTLTLWGADGLKPQVIRDGNLTALLMPVRIP